VVVAADHDPSRHTALIDEAIAAAGAANPSGAPGAPPDS